MTHLFVPKLFDLLTRIISYICY